ncbi:MAG: protein translocase subunit SecD [Chloroflexi bacterium]|nr:protein translocase subunit SecD [Chloroflexota bacterium]
MTTKNNYMLLFILAIVAFSLWAILPLDGERLGREGFRLGLDLRGGTQLVYEADLTKKEPGQSDADVMEAVVQKIRNRVDAFGVTEPVIQTGGVNQILVQLPGVKDIEQAKTLIGQTAELKFMELSPDSLDASGNLMWQDGTQQKVPWDTVGFSTIKQLTEQGKITWIESKAVGSNGQEEALTGRFLKSNSQVVLAPNTNEPEVSFEWRSEGATLFEQITRRMLQKPLGIFLDQQLITAPRVQSVIRDKGVINGVTLEEGRLLAIQLNSGSLDAPLKIVQELDVDATSGADSLRLSLTAGIIGLAMVFIFMVAYYRIPGTLAGMALLIYGVILLAIFKLIPVTLTLPGIAGVIISIGMAVDANVLVFERLREELRSGLGVGAAVQRGFDRAWSSIRDSNVSTFITCAVLYWMGSTFGAAMVQGFALTLFIGVAVSMFTALTVTRTLIRVFMGTRVMTPRPGTM